MKLSKLTTFFSVLILTVSMGISGDSYAGGGGKKKKNYGYRCMENKISKPIGGGWCPNETTHPKIKFSVAKSWGIAWVTYYTSPEISFNGKNCYKSDWDNAYVRYNIKCKDGSWVSGSSKPSMNCPSGSSRDQDYYVDANGVCKKK